MQSKSKVAAALCALLLLVLVSSPAMAGNNHFVALTWNVRGNTSPLQPHTPRNLSAVKSQLVNFQNWFRASGYPINVYAFQEIYESQAYELAQALGIPRSNVYFFGTKPNYPIAFGNAMMTPLLNVVSAGREGRSIDYLYQTTMDFNKSHEFNLLGGMTVLLPTGQKMRVYDTHLVGDNSVADQAANNAVYAWKQFADAARIIDNNGLSYPSIMMGDFNVHPPTSSYRPAYTQLNYLGMIWLQFRDLWAEWAPSHGNPNEMTEPGLGKRIDYVVTRGPRVSPLALNVPDTGAASDHRPMIAHLTF
ncbi:MAG TPA: endonuclease/exonuclease/phosphatase family protein [Pyrinomonadaceae bacterium]